MTFGGGDSTDLAVFERLLENMQGISGFTLDMETRTVVAFADQPLTAQDEIVRALLASGLYPIMSSDADAVDKAGRLAC